MCCAYFRRVIFSFVPHFLACPFEVHFSELRVLECLKSEFRTFWSIYYSIKLSYK